MICIISSFFDHYILKNEKRTTIQSLISILYLIIIIYLIDRYYYSNISNSLRNTYYLSKNIKNNNEKNIKEIFKIFLNLGNLFQYTINASIDNIILFILLLCILLISFILLYYI